MVHGSIAHFSEDQVVKIADASAGDGIARECAGLEDRAGQTPLSTCPGLNKPRVLTCIHMRTVPRDARRLFSAICQLVHP